MAANMEVFYKPTPDLTVKLECRGIEEMFQYLAPLQEILGNCTCGKCNGSKIRFVHRTTPDKHDVYELLCEKCFAKLELGKTTEGNLFPRRYEQEKVDGKWVPKVDKDGKKVYRPDGGWVKWDGKKYV